MVSAFAFLGRMVPPKKRWATAPPVKLPLPPKEFYLRLAEIMAALEVHGFGCIVPEKYVKLVPSILSGFKRQNTLDFKNGGLQVQFQVWERV